MQVTVTAGPGAPAGVRKDGVNILLNSIMVGGPYTLTVDTPFSMTCPVFGASGDTFAVTALLSADWVTSTGEFFGPGIDRTAAATATLPTDCDPPSTPGFGQLTGGGNTIDTASGLKMTRGFTIHCDLLLSNNLEINWPGAAGRQNQFHMLEHTAATCTDDPLIDQRPPRAPVDRIDGVGTGRFNGVLGYTIHFTLIDAGEPGTADQIGLRIVGPNGTTEVLNMPLQNITGGNVQAHYDQPHRNRP